MADAIERLEMTEVLNTHQIHIDVAADGCAGLYAANSAHESPLASVTGRTEIAAMVRRPGASG
jgi:hypothetical protein